MWKKPLGVSAEISPALLGAVSFSSDFASFSIGVRRFRDSCSRSGGTTGALRKLFPFVECSILGGPIGVEIDSVGSLLVRRCKLFCSVAENFRCWNCGAGGESAAAFLFCRVCCTVQPVDESVDYFQIFGLRREYQIELEELEKTYKDWQKKLHPDLVHTKSQRERDYAAEQSAHVIGAYRTLADPLSRAIYIAKLEGASFDEEERITDPELLAEIMEVREAIDESEDTESLNKIRDQMQEKFRYWSNSFDTALNTKNRENSMSSIRRMTYYRRAIEEIVKKL